MYDCAAKYLGESLNDKCYQGPDLNNKLRNVPLKFCQHEVAFIRDIEAMYYQVKVAKTDCDALHYLWYNEKGEIQHYHKNMVYGVHVLQHTLCGERFKIKLSPTRRQLILF